MNLDQSSRIYNTPRSLRSRPSQRECDHAHLSVHLNQPTTVLTRNRWARKNQGIAMSSLSQILNSVFSRFKNQPSIRQKPKQDYLFSFQQLESRELLAGINLNAAGNLIISGGAGNDIGQVTMLSSTTVRAEITGCESQDFSLASISNVTFRGFAGNDRFTNSTSLTSRQIGGDGNDTLIGGTGACLLYTSPSPRDS